jgi:hypothetical protein
MGFPYFFSIEGKYEAGPVNFFSAMRETYTTVSGFKHLGTRAQNSGLLPLLLTAIHSLSLRHEQKNPRQNG